MPRKVSSWSNSLNFINLFVMNWLINHCDITNQLINLWITSTNVNLIDHLATSPSTIGGGRGHLKGASRGVPGDLLRCHHGVPSKRAPVKENGSDNTHGAPDITFALITSCVWWSCQHKKLSFAWNTLKWRISQDKPAFEIFRTNCISCSQISNQGQIRVNPDFSH